MKLFRIMALSTVLVFTLLSCAGSPESGSESGSSSSAESSVSSQETPSDPLQAWVKERETVMYTDGTVDKKIEYSYDNSGNLTKISERDGRNELLYLRTYKFDGTRPVSQEISDRFGILSSTVYETDDNGMVVRETKQDAQGEKLSVVSFEYSEGLLSKSVAADGEGVPHLSAEYVYKDDIVVEIKYLLPSGAEEAVFSRELKNGTVIEEKTVLPDGSIETARKFIYENNLLSGEEHYGGTRLTKTVSFDHDSAGNIIRETWTNRSGRDYEVVERQWIEIEVVE